MRTMRAQYANILHESDPFKYIASRVDHVGTAMDDGNCENFALIGLPIPVDDDYRHVEDAVNGSRHIR